jgi:KDO2-lipid IV(A) lauroyltransferase
MVYPAINPKGKSDFHWNSFMGIEVPVHTDPEMLAKRYDLNVILQSKKKKKRLRSHSDSYK